MPEAVICGTLLGFDFGTKRIGVAVGETTTGTARALTTIPTRDGAALQKLLHEWKPAGCVVGLPLAEDGTNTEMTRAARRFAGHLASAYPVYLCDERYTSVEARSRFAEHRARGSARKSDARLMDAMAAQLILESWLNEGPERQKSLQFGAAENPTEHKE